MLCLFSFHFRFKTNMQDIIVTYPEVESSMRKWRAKSSDKMIHPHSALELTDQLPPKQAASSSILLNDEQFVHAIPSSCPEAGTSVILFTGSKFDQIDKKNCTVFADGTFKYFPSFFMQLYVLHFLVEKHVS